MTVIENIKCYIDF